MDLDIGSAKEDFSKQNILLLGLTGAGKTYLVREIAPVIDVSSVMADATKFSEIATSDMLILKEFNLAHSSPWKKRKSICVAIRTYVPSSRQLWISSQGSLDVPRSTRNIYSSLSVEPSTGSRKLFEADSAPASTASRPVATTETLASTEITP